MAVVVKNTCAASKRVDQQIQVAVAIDVRKSRSRRILLPARDSCFTGDVLKSPVPKIPVEHARSAELAEEEIAPDVAVNVSSSRPRPAEQIPIRDGTLVGEVVCKGDPGRFAVEPCET